MTSAFRPPGAPATLRPHRPNAPDVSFRRIIIWLLVGAAIAAGAGFWARHAVQESIDDILESTLSAFLDISSTALRIWIENELSRVETWARNPFLAERISELLKPSRTTVLTTPDDLREEIRQFLTSSFTDTDLVGFAVVDEEGRIVAASKPDRYVHRRIHEALMPVLKRVLSGEVVFHPPVMKGSLVEGLDDSTEESVIKTGAPVWDATGETIAALIFTINPEEDFSQLLSTRRAGGTDAHTYVFNGEGRLISESPFEDRLAAAGLLTSSGEAQSILGVEIRDPGGDVTQGFTPQSPIGQWPLTRMAKAALRGESGMDIDGYRDYRGVRVVGAWRWMPDLGIGIATEINEDRLRRIVGPTRRAFWGMTGLLLTLAALMLWSWIRIHRLKQRIEDSRVLGPYTLEEKIGEGGMGTVYRASHILLKRPTAVKLLKPDALTEDSLERFEREVQITSRLTHPNTIEVFDFGHTPDGRFYYAMEYLPGLTLDQLIELEGPISPARVVHILRQVCGCLGEAHKAGLVHRDIKPPNIMVCERGGVYDRIKVLDFGLVKDIEAVDAQLTAVHGVLGTPAYIAPERLADPTVNDSRSDLYSIGAVAFNLLTASDVFDGATAVEIAYHGMKTQPQRPSERLNAPLPEALDRLILDCLAKSPEDRPQSVADILDRLDGMADAVGPWTPEEAKDWWERCSGEIARLRGRA
ncbi:MAG: serine/threonine protein kinase [Desulfobacterales bacterium]|jgi:tRNA A-37 threonylcarbamoyl transferase component Bud32